MIVLTDKVEQAPMHLILVLCSIGLLRMSNVGTVSLAKFDK